MLGRLCLFSILAALIFSCGFSNQPADEQIKQDLIGKTLADYNGKHLWKFNTVTDFVDLRIIDKKAKNEIVQYTIDSTLMDAGNNTKYSAEFVVYYKYANKKWEIVHLYAKRFSDTPSKKLPL